MIKYVVISLNLIGIYIMSLFSGDVSVSVSAPEMVNPGNDFVMEIRVNKGDLESFARFQQELPVGFSATVIDAANGDFSFKDQKVKVIWLKLSSENEFIISYNVHVDETVQGLYSFGGQFSYIQDNERKTIDVEPVRIMVTSEELADNNDSTQVSPTDTSNVVTQPTGENYCYRSYDFKDGAIIVELLVNKQSVGADQFAKVQEDIPEGFTAEGVETQGGIFTFKDQKAKFLWMTLPSEDEFKVSYKLLTSQPVDLMTFNYDGKFSFIEDGNTMTIPIIKKDFSGEYLADDNTNNNNQDDSNNTDNNNQGDSNDNNNSDDNNQDNQITSIPDPQKSVSYSVQICALRNYRKPTYFNSNKYNFADKVNIESHEGWNKYTVGAFDEYKGARDYRVKIWTTTIVDDAFVAAYNNGQRITVQEALMISNQKWYQ